VVAGTGNHLRLRFSSIEGGLNAADGGTLHGFTIAGADRQFKPAHATIDGDSIIVSSPQVTAPLAARYAFEDAPTCNLCNHAGLPASPFRTDQWEIVVKSEQ